MKFYKLLLTQLLSKKGELDLSGGEDNNQDQNNEGEQVDPIESAAKAILDKINSMATAKSKDKETKQVNESEKQDILDKVYEAITQKQSVGQDQVDALTKQLGEAQSQIRAYQLKDAVTKAANDVGMNEDGIELFSQLVNEDVAFDKSGKLQSAKIEEKAKSFIEKYNVFSKNKNGNFGVSYLNYSGKDNGVRTPDPTKMSDSQRLELYMQSQSNK